MVIISRKKDFWGFIPFKGLKYVFVISMPENSQQLVPLLKIDWRLHKLLGDSLSKFLLENEFSSPMDLYNQFNVFVINNLSSNFINNNEETVMWLQHPLRTSILLKDLLKEIRNTKDYLKEFDIESRLVKIEIKDPQLRIHKVVLKLSQNYKIQPILVLNHDLPLQKIGDSPLNLNNIFSIAEFCEKFVELVTHFQQFWNMIAIIDSQCCVLDPPHPTFKDIFRRIKISSTMSVILTFNPFCSSHIPNIKILGSKSGIAYHQAVLQKNLENELWDVERDLMFNLSSVLEVSIPNKIYREESEDMDLAESGECAICFTFRFENKAPSEICENANCKSIYHSVCLFTYLSSIPRNRDYFGKIQGECPNCEDIIFCTVPKLI